MNRSARSSRIRTVSSPLRGNSTIAATSRLAPSSSSFARAKAASRRSEVVSEGARSRRTTRTMRQAYPREPGLVDHAGDVERARAHAIGSSPPDSRIGMRSPGELRLQPRARGPARREELRRSHGVERRPPELHTAPHSRHAPRAGAHWYELRAFRGHDRPREQARPGELPRARDCDRRGGGDLAAPPVAIRHRIPIAHARRACSRGESAPITRGNGRQGHTNRLSTDAVMLAAGRPARPSRPAGSSASCATAQQATACSSRKRDALP